MYGMFGLECKRTFMVFVLLGVEKVMVGVLSVEGYSIAWGEDKLNVAWHGEEFPLEIVAANSSTRQPKHLVATALN